MSRLGPRNPAFFRNAQAENKVTSEEKAQKISGLVFIPAEKEIPLSREEKERRRREIEQEKRATAKSYCVRGYSR
jgi:hypothetical protein